MTTDTCTIRELHCTCSSDERCPHHSPDLAHWRTARIAYLAAAERLDLHWTARNDVLEQEAHDALADEAQRVEACILCGRTTLGTAYCADADQEPVQCAWFLACPRPATSYTPHPILGPVPTCARCAKLAVR